MKVNQSFAISGVGRYLPSKKVSSKDVEKELNLPTGWIMKRIGVETRYHVIKESSTTMGAAALRAALEDANIKLDKVDCLIAAAASFDYVIPNRSCLIKNEFEEAKNLDFPCLDINTVCTSFVTALDHAAYLINSRNYKHVAIVSSELSSKRLNSKDHETYSLFGDAAVAAIVSATESDAGMINYCAKTYSETVHATIIKGGGNVYDFKNYPYDEAFHSFQMQGTKLLREAKKVTPKYLDAFFKDKTYQMSDIDWMIPHQTSLSGMKIVSHLAGVEEKRLINILKDYGNCISASIPLGLYEAIKTGKLKNGDTALLIGTAAGLTISGILIRYAK